MRPIALATTARLTGTKVKRMRTNGIQPKSAAVVISLEKASMTEYRQP